jgi:hypothetical protein
MPQQLYNILNSNMSDYVHYTSDNQIDKLLGATALNKMQLHHRLNF